MIGGNFVKLKEGRICVVDFENFPAIAFIGIVGIFILEIKGKT
jgi:hypothetical protein